MNSWLKLENASAIIASVTVASLCVAIVFLLGYARDSSFVILSYASYRDILLIAAQAFLSNLFFFAGGAIVSWVSGPAKRNVEQGQQLRTYLHKIFDFVAGSRFPARALLLILSLTAIFTADQIPKQYLGNLCVALLATAILFYFVFCY